DTQKQMTMQERIFGVVTGIVTNNQDPDNLGRVKVRFPWLTGGNSGRDTVESYWARIATPMAGSKYGVYFLPEQDTEVLVVFEQGDVRFPYIIGGLWNGKQIPPETNEKGRNIGLIKTKSGHMIRLNDTGKSEKIEVIDSSGNNMMVIDTPTNSITITAAKDITLSAPKGTIKLDARSININSSLNTKIDAGTEMNISASTTISVSGEMINLN
ncbi:MAG TPA: phage baseplate assembly protein V, partial [Chroococcales cyanobacterium]